ncbi:hypothetical protein LIV57_06775 [Chryseobacterium sp. X308]|uniref:hypothetical protein n=1 Tax=Chryseobacterium sp. X308 TaxID=2884873 RepID=UPI001D1471F7|nr:hypothetical protein [Chryseobacterium sp. X308]MCC3214971.1 hypothetical protein [Chryseobacterium sp. X308]
MIEPHELRIGNFVEVENYKIIQLENIHPKGTTKGDEIYLSSMLKPIELSEHWLLKFGFKHTGGGFYTHLPSLIQACNVSDKFYNVGFKDSNIGRFYYVHQLQNLYFALTGEELKIKES